MSHLAFIAWAYAVVAVGVIGLVAHVWFDLRRQSRRLAELERQGLTRRRRAREGVEP